MGLGDDLTYHEGKGMALHLLPEKDKPSLPILPFQLGKGGLQPWFQPRLMEEETVGRGSEAETTRDAHPGPTQFAQMEGLVTHRFPLLRLEAIQGEEIRFHLPS
jgi:hypothetical protein